MKTNLEKLTINGESEWVVKMGETLCLTPYIDEDGCRIEDMCLIVRSICGNVMAVANGEVIDHSDVDINHTLWYSKQPTHRGHRSNSRNKMRLRMRRITASAADDDLPF